MSASSSSGPPTSSAVKRACDSCHRRKVKCIGEGMKPCKNCNAAGLTCTYNAIPQKKGPKGSRAKVLSELRETQRQSQLAPHSPFDRSIPGRSVSPAFARTPGLLTPELLECCIDYYFTNIYPTQPIMHRARVQQTVLAMDYSNEAYCKLTAFCAYMMIQPNLILPPRVAPRSDAGPVPNLTFGQHLLEESIRVRKSYEYIENPNLLTIYTAFFIFSCYFCLDKQNAAWSYLRQAMTLAHIIGMHDEESYKTGDIIENSRKRRLFWVLFMTERAYAFKRHRPLTMYATINMPTIDEDPTDTVPLQGFIHLINLYRPFDETFFGLWNRTRDGAVPSWLVQLQKTLSNALPTYLESMEVQAVDIRMSQLWLKTMVWQLAISHGFISSVATDNTLSFRYPIDISRELVDLSNEFSQHAMEVHGIGLIEKLFDVACTLADVMACVPIEQAAFELGPRDYLQRFISLISSLRGGQSRHLPLLIGKINDVLPGYNTGPPHTMPLPVSRPLPSSLPNARLEEIYESSTGPSNPNSQSATPYDSPRQAGLPLRHGSTSSHSQLRDPGRTSHYPDIPSHSGAYPDFGSAINPFPGGSTTDAAAQGLYPTHLPADHARRYNG
ncbi:hypothetical protein K402DRAFT_70860 [Aulographum hederae CBS 113979]|uniref:Zn(2)-C6 fungal-type domain-containing protein n=1 Tax=Aulographum hederae CBS 113979 TaxID=1176131 RepID=A0A6G1HF78_9PEZI|nr:hypothetical protein K402DRAFT_70860 [Aulographum hederae CBS 113979]